MLAAEQLAHRVRSLVPTWHEEVGEPGMWTFIDGDDDYPGRTVIVDGREGRQVLIEGPREGLRVGPSLIGVNRDVTVAVHLPPMTDNCDLRSALDALAAIEALPHAS
jgi:hypothetical protein